MMAFGQVHNELRFHHRGFGSRMRSLHQHNCSEADGEDDATIAYFAS
jgi:hypothetical protein